MSSIYVISVYGTILYISTKMIRVHNYMLKNMGKVQKSDIRSYSQFTRYFKKKDKHSYISTTGSVIEVVKYQLDKDYKPF
jgi:hypothetical protein